MSRFKYLQAYCLAKPGAVEDYPWGDTVWKLNGKMFAAGGEHSVTVKATLDEQAMLLNLPYITKAAYVGRHGWVSIDITEDEAFAHAKDLIDRSYELVAPKKKSRG